MEGSGSIEDADNARKTEFYHRAYIGQHVVRCFAPGEEVPFVATKYLDAEGLDYEPQLFVPVEIDDQDHILVNDQDDKKPTLIQPNVPFTRKPIKVRDPTLKGLPMRFVDTRGVIHILGI